MSSTAAAPRGSGLPGSDRVVRTFTRQELAARTDALALTIGTRATASALLLACVVVILIGAQSLLSAMQDMDRDIKTMNGQLAVANGGLDVLNTTMESLPKTSASLERVLVAVKETGTQVTISGRNIGAMGATTDKLGGRLDHIATGTKAMGASLDSTAKGTVELGSTVGTLNDRIPPLVATQHEMLGGLKQMRAGLDGMNASLAYVVRQLNYMTAPPGAGGMVVLADLPKETLPPIPGLSVTTDPVSLFPRMSWPIYTSP